MIFRVINILISIHISLSFSDIMKTPMDFSRHKLINIFPKSIHDLDILSKLETKYKIDFWSPLAKDFRPVKALIIPSQTSVYSALREYDINFEDLSINVQKLINDYMGPIQISQRQSITNFNYSVYHPYDQIVAELKSVATKNKDRATYNSIGNSSFNNEIPSITITNTGNAEKGVVFLECGIHAREWIAPAACLWMANELLNSNSYQPLMDKYEFIIVPVLNPDGYSLTWNFNRFWRKTLSRGPFPLGLICWGTDGNRNWDAEWGQTGSSDIPCEETYRGRSPFSEPETRAMSNLILEKKKTRNLSAYFSIHSYSQFILYPPGHNSTAVANQAQLDDLAKKAQAAIKSVHGKVYKTGQSSTILYQTSGDSNDWVYEKTEMKVVLTFELRDEGEYGFLLPVNHIQPTGEEVLVGIKAILESI